MRFASSYITQPILPNIGIGGFELGVSIDEVIDAMKRSPDETEVSGDYVYHKYEGVEFSALNGVIDSITALEGYRGTTPQGVHVLMSWEELYEIHPDIGFDGTNWVWCLPEERGISFDIVRPPKPIESRPLPKEIEEMYGPSPPPQWVEEIYDIEDHEHAFVRSIVIDNFKCCPGTD